MSEGYTRAMSKSYTVVLKYQFSVHCRFVILPLSLSKEQIGAKFQNSPDIDSISIIYSTDLV